MLKKLNTVKVRAGIAALILTGGLLAAIALNNDSDDWHAGCISTPAAAADKHASDIAEARNALLRNGNDPHLGIAVVDLEACTVELSWKADQAQPTASVVKLLIALDLIDRSGVPSGSEATAVQDMLAASDDRVASRLWQQHGGPEIVRRQARKLGLAHTSPATDAGQWGSTRMSPTDVITVYRHITAGLSEEERDFLTEAMESAPRSAADGFDQHFGIPRAFPDADWAMKQGWGRSDRRRVLNTTGLVRIASRTFAVAVMGSWNETIDWPTATSALTAATGAVKRSLAASGT
ncbi:serine hydrolase [Kibdelosporangium aridum]|uniref:Beta-lactamase enzyme family protein n=1 Tax=Kibdelosporangium aridum TaxID=2030 RepID=A0A1Y5Y2H7_KIBAR|nr:serine hydrolase [Kibdelosporangium aridum]SMD22786.1 Beta-lactamase enzyme family protein [Kibdelosporangium aridum]